VIGLVVIFVVGSEPMMRSWIVYAGRGDDAAEQSYIITFTTYAKNLMLRGSRRMKRGK
jgi:hypothetical protein